MKVEGYELSVPDERLRAQIENKIQELLSKSYLSFRYNAKSSILFATFLDEFKRELGEIPKIDGFELEFNPLFSRVLRLETKLRQPYGILCDMNVQCFNFDEYGFLYEEIDLADKTLSAENEDTLFIQDKQKRNLEIGAKAHPDENVYAAIKTARAFLKNVGEPQVEQFILPATLPGEFHVQTSEGWLIYLDANTDFEKQLLAMETVLDDAEILSQAQRRQLEYFDLRIPGKIYFR